MTNACVDCSAPISRYASRCRQCSNAKVNACPEAARRRKEAIRRRFDDPEVMRLHIVRAKQRLEEWRKTPGAAEAMRRQGQIMRAVTARPDVRERWLAGREEAGRRRTETVLGWCPERLRDEYRRLQKFPNLKAAGARKAIEAMMTPFERAMMRVRAGAGISERFVPPPTRYDFTLGGVSEI